MEQKAYFCSWLISVPVSFDILDEIEARAADYAIELWIDYPWQQQDDSGYYTLLSTVVTRDAKNLELFASSISDTLTLMRAIEADGVSGGRLKDIPNTALSDFIVDLNRMLQINQAIDRNSALWAYGMWQPRLLSIEAIDALIQAFEQAQCELYLFPPFRTAGESSSLDSQWHMELVFNVTKVVTFEKFITAIGSDLNLTYWRWVYADSRREIDLRRSIQLSPENANQIQGMLREMDK